MNLSTALQNQILAGFANGRELLNLLQAAQGTVQGTQTANRVFAGPSAGGDAAATFRTLVAADLPAGVMTAVSQDTSPQLGGNLDANTHNITGAARVESKHFSAASGGTVTLTNNNANVASPSVSGNDSMGVVTLNFSGSISAGTQLTKVNFGSAYTSAPNVIATSANAGVSGGAGVTYYVDPSDITTGGFFIRNLNAITGSGSGKVVYKAEGIAGG